jgi:hypothetical protein
MHFTSNDEGRTRSHGLQSIRVHPNNQNEYSSIVLSLK